MSRVIGSLGRWEALIGGVLLIFTAIQNPEGIAGAFRTQAAEARLKKARKAAAPHGVPNGVAGVPASVSAGQP